MHRRHLVCASRKWVASLLRRIPADYAFLLFLVSLVVLWYINQYVKLLTLFPRHVGSSRISTCYPELERGC